MTMSRSMFAFCKALVSEFCHVVAVRAERRMQNPACTTAMVDLIQILSSTVAKMGVG